eukprot:1443782-Amphidinium_carterae.1
MFSLNRCTSCFQGVLVLLSLFRKSPHLGHPGDADNQRNQHVDALIYVKVDCRENLVCLRPMPSSYLPS